MKIASFFIIGFFLSTSIYGQWTTSGTHIYNSNSGNTGIGTASPSAKLDLQDAGNFKLFSFGTSSSGSGYQYGLWSNTGAAMLMGIESSSAGGLFYGSLPYASVWGTNNSTALHFSPNNTVAMTIIDGGNIGIGLTNPVTKLDISSTQSSTDGMRFSGVNHAYLSMKTTGGSGYSAGLEIIGGASGADWLMLTNRGDLSGNADDLLFYKNVAGSGSTGSKLRIRSNGNIGIGTSSPTEKLFVEGNISANGFITAKKMTVTQIGWSDYVFDKAYKLRTLSSLGSFIKQNKHLPEVPSAKEVEEKGISVGDNLALLLKKIEELTLYLIEINKKNESLEVSNRALVKRIKKIEHRF